MKKHYDPIIDEKVIVNIDTPEGRKFYENMEKDELTPLEAYEKLTKVYPYDTEEHEWWIIIETALKDYELMKQTKIIVADKKISDDDLEKLKSQRMLVGSSIECKVEPLFDEETQKKLEAFEIIKECNDKCPENNKIISHSQYDRPTDMGNPLHIDYLVIGNACFIITKDKYDLLKEVLL